MNTRSLLMLLASLVVGVAALPAYAACSDYVALAHYVSHTTSGCLPWPCTATYEKHWHIRFYLAAPATYSNWRAKGEYMSGSAWVGGGYMMYSPNKSGKFGSNCISVNPCSRCTINSTCSNSHLRVNICT